MRVLRAVWRVLFWVLVIAFIGMVMVAVRGLDGSGITYLASLSFNFFFISLAVALGTRKDPVTGETLLGLHDVLAGFVAVLVFCAYLVYSVGLYGLIGVSFVFMYLALIYLLYSFGD